MSFDVTADAYARCAPRFPGVREGHLVELFDSAGLHHIEPATLTVRVGAAMTFGPGASSCCRWRRVRSTPRRGSRAVVPEPVAAVSDE